MMILYARRKAVAELSALRRPARGLTVNLTVLQLVLQSGCQQFHVALPLLNVAARKSLPVVLQTRIYRV